MVLTADKGRASVVLDTETYRQKMTKFIESGPYRLLDKDPTDRLSRKSTEELLDLNRNGHLTEPVFNKIRSPKHNQCIGSYIRILLPFLLPYLISVTLVGCSVLFYPCRCPQ